MITVKAGQIVESIALNDRAFLYGDGCFSTVRVVAGQACLWPHHLHRLRDCQRRLDLQVELELRLSNRYNTPRNRLDRAR
jgi:4-amino-4-deoxychorismate lyase